MKKFLFPLIIVLSMMFLSSQLLMAKQDTQATGTIRGGVYLDENGDGICVGTDNVEPIPGIDVSFESGSQHVVLYSGSNGTFGLPTAAQGLWQVTVKPDLSKWRVTSPDSQQVHVSDDEGLVQLNVDFCLQPGSGATSTGSSIDSASPSTSQYGYQEEVDVLEEIRQQVNEEADEPLTQEQEFSAMSEALLTNPPEPTPHPEVEAYQHVDVHLVSEEDWLAYLNLFRELADLPRLQGEEQISEGSQLHSRYMVMYDEPIAHSESPEKDLYTPPGDNAARNSNIYSTTEVEANYIWGINFWMSGPFHLVPLIDPALETVGYGNYNHNVGTFNMAAVMDVRTAEEDSESAVTYPIYFPGQDSRTWIVRHSMYEWPDPLESCPGYQRPTGPPLVLQLGDGSKTPNVTSYKVSKGDIVLDSCLITESNYINQDPYAQSTGRVILGEQDAIVIMPRYPLEGDATYTVEVVADGYSYVWQFSTGPVPGSE